MKIRQRVNACGGKSWQLDLGRVEGRRKRLHFRSKEEALAALAREKKAREKRGTLGGDIGALEMAEIVAMRARLMAAGASISEAGEFFLANAKVLREPVSLAELAQRYRDSREEADQSTAWVALLKSHLGSLAAFYPAADAHEVTPEMIQRWLRAPKHKGWAAATRNGYLGSVSAMFQWAMSPLQGHVRTNPCEHVARQADDRKGRRPSLDVEQCRQLLEAAAMQRRWRVLAFVVLGLFAGLRPEAEATDWKFEWSDINLEERTVRLTEAVVKTGPGRVVDLTEEACAWLRLIPQDLRKEGPVVPLTSWQNEWTVFRHGLGWRVMSDKTRARRCQPEVKAEHGEWPSDVLRHSFASYYLAHYQDLARLQVQMGHENLKMLRSYYLAVRTRREGAAFWALGPTAELLAALREGTGPA